MSTVGWSVSDVSLWLGTLSLNDAARYVDTNLIDRDQIGELITSQDTKGLQELGVPVECFQLLQDCWKRLSHTPNTRNFVSPDPRIANLINHGIKKVCGMGEYDIDLDSAINCFQQAWLLGSCLGLALVAYLHNRKHNELRARKLFCLAIHSGLEDVALSGHPIGQWAFGYAACYGFGIPQDDERAMYWYRASARQGHPCGQCSLGFMFDHGRGVEMSSDEAVYWYSLSCEQGNAVAQFNLGCMHEHGRGVKLELGQAAKWYLRSATQGNAEAQNNIACLYRDGHGVEQSDAVAVEWFQKSVRQGTPNAQCSLGFMYEHARGVKQDKGYAIELYKAAARQRNPTAINNLRVLGVPFYFPEE